MGHHFVRGAIFLFMAGILWALGTGLYALLCSKAESKKLVKALTVRVGLSLFLFAALWLGLTWGSTRFYSACSGKTALPL